MIIYCVQVLELEGEKGEWGFKALKQMIKINFKLVSDITPASCHTLNIKKDMCEIPLHVFTPLQTNFPEMMNRYKQLLTYIRSAVTRNYSEKSINSILDYISTSKQVGIPGKH